MLVWGLKTVVMPLTSTWHCRITSSELGEVIWGRKERKWGKGRKRVMGCRELEGEGEGKEEMEWEKGKEHTYFTT